MWTQKIESSLYIVIDIGNTQLFKNL